jgi:hypothetical protein
VVLVGRDPTLSPRYERLRSTMQAPPARRMPAHRSLALSNVSVPTRISLTQPADRVPDYGSIQGEPDRLTGAVEALSSSKGYVHMPRPASRTGNLGKLSKTPAISAIIAAATHPVARTNIRAHTAAIMTGPTPETRRYS